MVCHSTSTPLTRRRFLAVAGGVPVVAAVRSSGRPDAAQASGLAERFEERFEQASRLVEAQTDSGDVAAAVLHVRQGDRELSRAFGARASTCRFSSPRRPSR